MTFRNYNRECQLPVLTIIIILNHQGGSWGAWHSLLTCTNVTLHIMDIV